MSTDEQKAQYDKDLEYMKDQCVRADIMTIDICEKLIRYSEVELKQCGYKSKEDAILTSIRDNFNRKKKIRSEFTKKYPD